TKAIRREMRRRAAIEPVIGHLKEDHRMGRNYLTGRHGDRINAVLAAAGYNFSLLLRWFEELLRVLSLILCHALATPLHLTRCRKTFFTADYVTPLLSTCSPAIIGVTSGRQSCSPYTSLVWKFCFSSSDFACHACHANDSVLDDPHKLIPNADFADVF